jgi:hypothetical protein
MSVLSHSRSAARGGFWSLTMYDKDYFILPKSSNGREATSERSASQRTQVRGAHVTDTRHDRTQTEDRHDHTLASE